MVEYISQCTLDVRVLIVHPPKFLTISYRILHSVDPLMISQRVRMFLLDPMIFPLWVRRFQVDLQMLSCWVRGFLVDRQCFSFKKFSFLVDPPMLFLWVRRFLVDPPKFFLSGSPLLGLDYRRNVGKWWHGYNAHSRYLSAEGKLERIKSKKSTALQRIFK